MSEEIDEVSRYQKILEDWKPSSHMPRMPNFGGQSVRPAPDIKPRTFSQQDQAVGQSYAAGSILRLNRNTYGVYDRPVPEKGYHLVHVLNPHGSTKTQGIALEGHQVEEIGELPAKWFHNLQQSGQWNRDLIMFHCYRYEDAATIPVDNRPQAAPQQAQPLATPPRVQPAAAPREQPAARTQEAPVPPTPPSASESPLKRGNHLTVKFGSKAWDAIYWGHDDQGHVVAHKPNGHWSLMHLDLERFQNTGLVVNANVDPILVRAIEESLLSQQQ